ncbi:MAG: ABC transporter ATP-binding protein [Rhodospirillaceae bacterium]|jgi:branched-chain amino acid transport system ATP-binding protein|nr:ABC transporter ATP-binding protein [Rhodospirillaceae bacterium]MBT5039902.1 ABC transporter ATP-binding protein [Rhodospirillaceae bacterium]MBT5677458.1 ABC transporter ATP-binding protein [Rhodospirillaceae bacterium]MBT5781109.1 ABC transporter ATP-binding protein [Rhodospirillaceae bacterium]MBT6829243.1 ABC transporter ATP-binding protein [Rhodospirillaceae bacterium]
MLLNVENITVHYSRLPALRGISVSVDEGEIVCIVGPNGAGKSTTLLSISGVLNPTEGEITFHGKRINGMSPEAVARAGISQVPEGRHVFTSLSVEENLRIGTNMRKDRSDIEKDFKHVLEIFPVLAERRKQAAGKLSGGEQQMLVIGRALLTNPRMMTIDEPSLGLAPNLVDRVYETLLELRKDRGLTLLIVEQSSERALTAADRLYVLRSGEMQLEGNAADLRDGEKVRQAYFGFEEGTTHEGEVAF